MRAQLLPLPRSRAPVSPRRSLLLALATLPCTLVNASPTEPDKLDANFIQQSIDALANTVDQEYFDPEIASEIARRLRQQHGRGSYDDAASYSEIAKRLTKDMLTVSSDKHLHVHVNRPTRTTDSATAPPKLSRKERGRRDNHGVQRVEVLKGNVGYLNLTHFYRPEEATAVLSNAMKVLQHSDALIVDMRENTGGSPGTVAFFASYLFESTNMPLFAIFDRSNDQEEYCTGESLPAESDSAKPVFVLTSRKTFSAGEGLAFILQERKRATVVGETTAGAANPGRPFDINDRLSVTIPTGFIRTSVRRRSWEGEGVTPDVPCPASKALEEAHLRALRRLKKIE